MPRGYNKRVCCIYDRYALRTGSISLERGYKLMKRFLTALLALVLVFGCLAFAANAETRLSPEMICTERKYHWFGNWEPNGHGGHSAYCLWNYCVHSKQYANSLTNEISEEYGYDHWVNDPIHVKCAFIDRVVNGETVSVDPVCGDIEGAEPLEFVEVQLGRKVPTTLPQPCVRVGKTASGDEIMTACFEMSGIISKYLRYESATDNEPIGVHKVILPSSFAERTFTLVAEDGTETTLSTFINANGTVTLTLDLNTPVLIRLG